MDASSKDITANYIFYLENKTISLQGKLDELIEAVDFYLNSNGTRVSYRTNIGEAVSLDTLESTLAKVRVI
jgi:hypothetical protein